MIVERAYLYFVAFRDEDMCDFPGPACSAGTENREFHPHSCKTTLQPRSRYSVPAEQAGLAKSHVAFLTLDFTVSGKFLRIWFHLKDLECDIFVILEIMGTYLFLYIVSAA